MIKLKKSYSRNRNCKREYKEAYESGDSDKILAAQEKLNRAHNEQFRVESYKPPVREAEKEVSPSSEPSKPPVQKRQEPTSADKAWLEKNDEWFNKPGHEEMTGFAYGIHEKLVKANINPSLEPDEYYKRVDEGLRQAFPKYFNKQSVEEKEVEATPRTAGTVVAPVDRSAKTTQSAINLYPNRTRKTTWAYP